MPIVAANTGRCFVGRGDVGLLLHKSPSQQVNVQFCSDIPLLTQAAI